MQTPKAFWLQQLCKHQLRVLIFSNSDAGCKEKGGIGLGTNKDSRIFPIALATNIPYKLSHHQEKTQSKPENYVCLLLSMLGLCNQLRTPLSFNWFDWNSPWYCCVWKSRVHILCTFLKIRLRGTGKTKQTVLPMLTKCWLLIVKN